ncbi:two-component sensor histidine kinase [Streptomyces spiralis]|uniref:Signal transduction histidine-protein kinase/phosphatase MprB n=1 Tax=Streptomyces spiralis TaxID=66376 RepID=A0A919DLZ6_9ACTN|nr:HAMP domain-containing sensor histidine kinase [Streptomyces spiralis]GHE61748.1 two-component sensor histidine kinase [Streptomyces spiralis]
MSRPLPVLRCLAPRTLRGRLSPVALTAAALLMTILTVVFNAVMDRHLQHQADDELRNRAAAVATTVDTTGPRVRVLETVNDRLLDANVWIYAGTRLLEKPPSATAGSPPTQAADRLAAQRKHACATVDAHGRGPVRLCAQPLPGRRTGATVVTALDLTPYRSSADTLLVGSLILDAVMLGSTYVLTRLSVGRALRPVRTMTDQATQWSAVGSDERFGTEDRPAELARLGASLDALLDRIRTVLRHEQQLTGELSHELRTPLTRIIMELDWWRARPRTDAETSATQAVIAEAARSMRTICDTLLNDARENALNPAAVPGTTDVVPVLDRLLRCLDRADQVKTAVETEAQALEAGVAPALVERILSPLLANAARYAHSRVTVSARRVPGAVRIDVVDDGPGVPETFGDELFQPGRRADPGDGHDGAGLGLPLARRLARAVGGEVSYDPRHAPGTRFTVSLPAG